jgi:hypothetical protein
MRPILPILLLLSASIAYGQKNTNPTNAIAISGKIKQQLTLTLADLDTFSAKPVPDIAITNHLGVVKKTAKNLRGIPLKNLLDKVELQADNPKIFSAFYFVFVASDGYKVVFSWNEIFNTETGNNLYLITEQDGKKIREMDDSILIVSTTDFKTGRRYVKGLEKIIVEKAE